MMFGLRFLIHRYRSYLNLYFTSINKFKIFDNIAKKYLKNRLTSPSARKLF